MNSEQSLARIRQFLLIISAAVFIMTVVQTGEIVYRGSETWYTGGFVKVGFGGGRFG